INDQYGHIEGDHALRLVARALKESTGEIPCLISRWGGDEFVIIVRGRRFDDPGVIPNAVNDRLADLAKQEGASYPLRLSFGYVECTSPDMRPSEILARADQFMYKNKEKAREDSGAA
ncbi:MAG: GGDEF domain-containing protein, partial [Eggerthellaceae bacterium]|nr:GGDEF domain-containing protein [Eggerthellaceae bacterium]